MQRPSAGVSSASSPSTSPAGPSPSQPAATVTNKDYLTILYAEWEKLVPFTPILPYTTNLLHQEILRAQALVQEPAKFDCTLQAPDSPPIPPTSSSMGFRPIAASSSKEAPSRVRDGNHQMTRKLVVPVEKYPTFNFIGRILGPRGSYLQRLEQQTGCKIMIRGKGSMKNREEEEAKSQEPGNEHLQEPLHLVIVGSAPTEEECTKKLDSCRQILDDLLVPVDEENDTLKRQQLRELAELKAAQHTHRREGLGSSPTPSSPTASFETSSTTSSSSSNGGSGTGPNSPQKPPATGNSAPTTRTSRFENAEVFGRAMSPFMHTSAGTAVGTGFDLTQSPPHGRILGSGLSIAAPMPLSMLSSVPSPSPTFATGSPFAISSPSPVSPSYYGRSNLISPMGPSNTTTVVGPSLSPPSHFQSPQFGSSFLISPVFQQQQLQPQIQEFGTPGDVSHQSRFRNPQPFPQSQTAAPGLHFRAQQPPPHGMQ